MPLQGCHGDAKEEHETSGGRRCRELRASPALLTLIKHCDRSAQQCNMTRKSKRGIQIGRDIVKGRLQKTQEANATTKAFPKVMWSQIIAEGLRPARKRLSPVELTTSCAEFPGCTFCDMLPMLDWDGFFGYTAAFKSPMFPWVAPHPCHCNNSKYIDPSSKLFFLSGLSMVFYLW